MSANPESHQRHRLNVDDYHRMGEAGIFAPDARVELINGEIIDMSPIGSDHMSVVDRLTQLLVLALGKSAIVRTQGSIRLSDDSEPEPDLLLLAPREDFYRDTVAGPADVLLLIEVSVSSLRYDIDVKLPLYAERRIPEVWIVDIPNSRLLRHADPIDGRWRFEDAPTELDRVIPRGTSGISLDLSALFRSGVASGRNVSTRT